MSTGASDTPVISATAYSTEMNALDRGQQRSPEKAKVEEVVALT